MTLSSLVLLVADKSHAQSPAAVANTLRSRFWWADFGSFGNRPFGYLYMFGTQTSPAHGSGWYIGTRVTFNGMASAGSPLGFAWQPTSNGVIIDRGFSRETITFTQIYPAVEVVFLNGSSPNRWSTTRSPYTPSIIRQYYYR
jgi:hypothetical protein